MLVLQAGGGGRLAAEALDELRVLGEAPVEHLQRDLAPELLVVAQVDVGHAAGAEPALDPVAAVDDVLGVESLDHRLSRDSITALAIGAAIGPAEAADGPLDRHGDRDPRGGGRREAR